MWLLDFALRRPITSMVAIVTVVIMAALALVSMRVDIFPNLDLPVIYVVQPYGGMDPLQMEGYLVDWYEEHFFYIDGIQSVESKSIASVAMIKLTFHPGTDMAQAMSNTVGMVERSRAYMPPGTVGPFILRLDAGSVPVGYLVVSSPHRNLAQLEDIAITRVRPIFSSLPGVSGTPAFGGNQRTIVITLDPDKLRSYRLNADKVVDSLMASNVIVPNGDVRIDGYDRFSRINSVAEMTDRLKSTPITIGAGPAVFLRDISAISDSSDIPTGYALVNGKRTVYIPVVKLASASTLSVVGEVKAALEQMRHAVPADVSVDYVFDQSPYVTGAIMNVTREGIQGALLTSLMVLIFLGDMPSAGIVLATIPCSVLGALVLLYATGQTINIMTLGGLALSIGVLVDQATVTIENIHSHREEAQPLAMAVYNAGKETIRPNFLAMLAVISVFVPSLFMKGVTGALFVPLSLAVGFALLVSFVLSATLVPILSIWWLPEGEEHQGAGGMLQRLWDRTSAIPRFLTVSFLGIFNPGFPEGKLADHVTFERVRTTYRGLVSRLVGLGLPVGIGYLAVCCLVIAAIYPVLSRQVFPQVHKGQFAVRLRAPAGLRFERTAVLTNQLLAIITREAGGARNVKFSIGYVGTQPPAYATNNMYMFTSGPQEALLTVALNEAAGLKIEPFEDKVRAAVAREMPAVSLVFEPGDIVSKVMNLGAATPVEVAVTGLNLKDDSEYAAKLTKAMSTYGKFRDLQIAQPMSYPNVEVDVNRELAGQLGVTMKQVGRSLVEATSSSRWVAPNYWRDPKTGISYQVQMEYPQWHIASLSDLEAVPAMPEGQEGPFIRDVAKVHYGTEPGEIDHFNQQRMLTIEANVFGDDLGRAAQAVRQAIQQAGALPRGVFVKMRGQVPVMQSTFAALLTGLVLAALVILLMLTANFESLLLALVVISAVPGVLAGVVLALLLSGTSVNIQSFMGAIMAIGVGVANSILLVTFANGYWYAGKQPAEAAVNAGVERLRPILMTSLAMVFGMIPMAVSPEAESNLARAVIGGLLFSTPTVLFIVPVAFSLFLRHRQPAVTSIHPFDQEEAIGE